MSSKKPLVFDYADYPSEWPIYKVSELLFERNEKALNDGKYPLYSLTIEHGVIQKPERYVREFLVKSQDKAYKKVYKDDIVFNPMNLRWGAIAKSNLDNVGIVSPVYNILRVNNKIINPSYLIEFLKSDQMMRLYQRFAQGTLVERTSVDLDMFINFDIPVPSLSEQIKIATILSSVNNNITKTEAVIEQIEEVKNGLMQQLLTKGIGHIKFKKTEIGEIPASWDIVSLGDIISQLKAGVSVNCIDKPRAQNEFGVLKTSSVTMGVFKPEEHKTILREEVSRALCSPKKNHIIICRKNTPELVGTSAFVYKDYPDLFLPDLLWQIEIKDEEKVFPLWLSLLLSSSSVKSRISQMATGSTISMRNISKSSFLSLKIVLPSYEEQLKITKYLISLTRRITNESEYARCLASIKTALVQSLLTGKVRVNVDEAEVTQA
ncbi:restriction endonuclease subunit S [Cytobacillus pseudoceanisediminis]|uniref:restriction endonuclease subunit S n=1 Tax=Cytobacillus pseudoceanisediminis TaxID=3051614 RepID=UPI003CF78E56